jgi:hypothetical protein
MAAKVLARVVNQELFMDPDQTLNKVLDPDPSTALN